MKTRIALALAGLALLLAPVLPAGAEEEISAEEGMKMIVKVAKGKKPDLLDVVFPAKLVDDRREFSDEDVLAWREGFAKEIAKAKKIEVAQEGKDAVATWPGRSRRTVMAVRIHFTGVRWVLACAQSYMVEGPLLQKARGRRPAHVALVVRPDNSAYGKSAWSFPYATGEAGACKNRMSVWYCRYGDLHAVGDNEIADLGKAKLEEVKGLPMGLTFGDWVNPEVGHVYVVHCRRTSSVIIDFYAKLRVAAIHSDGIEIDWELLAAGPGAPASIHEAQPVPDARAGSDGCDGYCGGKMR